MVAFVLCRSKFNADSDKACGMKITLLQKLSPCHLSIEFENKCACSIENGRVFVLKQNADSVKACGMKITLLQKNLTLSLVNRI